MAYDDIINAEAQRNQVDPDLVRSMMQQESRGVPTAVSQKGASGLMQLMPATAKELGVSNIFDPQQNIAGGTKYLRQLIDKYGNVEHAVMAYNMGPSAFDQYQSGKRELPKETAQYGDKVSANFANLKKGIMPQENAANVDAWLGQGKEPTGGMQSVDAWLGAGSTQAQPVAAQVAPQQAPAQRSAFDETARQVGLTGRAAVTGLTALPTMAGDALNSLINMGIGGVNRVAGTSIPQLQMPSEVTQRALNAAGVPQPQNATERVVQDVAGSMAGTGGQVRLGQALLKNVPAAAGLGASLATAPGTQIAGSAGAAGAQGTARENDVGIAGQIAASLAGALGGTLGAQGVNAAARALGNRLAPRPVAPPTQPPVMPTAPETPVPPQKPAAPAAGAPIGQAAPEPYQVPELPRPKTKLAAGEQQANIDTMREIGLTSQRPSAITGDKFTAGQEFQHSKLDSPVGEVIRNQLATEQDAIKNYATNLVKNTGAKSVAAEEIGQNVRAPLQGLSEHYDTQIKGLYNAANDQAGGMPTVIPEGFGKLMGTNSMFAGKSENSSLRRGINAYMREQAITDGKGNMQPITVQQAEGLRQYLNSQWSPQNSGLIGKIKESLDFDVAKTGGGDLYKQARALHAERKNTLDNPKGIAALLNESGPEGINKIVPDEKMAAKILSMPTAQLNHVVKTLRGLPENLQEQGQSALAEIKGVLANRVYLAGDKGGTQNGPSIWNAANVTRELNALNSKLNLVFSPEEIAKFQTLNRAGHILQTPSAYPGAAVQGHNLVQRGLIMAPPAAGAAVGHVVGGLPGAAVGSALGSALSGRVSNAVENSNARRLAEELLNPKILK